MTTRELIDAGNVHLVKGEAKALFVKWEGSGAFIKRFNPTMPGDWEVPDMFEADIETWRINPAKVPLKLPKHKSMTRRLGLNGSTPWVQLLTKDWQTLTDINAPTLKEARNRWRVAILADQASRP